MAGQRAHFRWPPSTGIDRIVRLLLDNGANIDAAGVGSWTALSCAAKNGHEEVVKMCIGGDADIDATRG